MTETNVPIHLRVNGQDREGIVNPRLLLSDFLRHGLGLTGTHVGCEHGVCGACTVEIDGSAVRSCLMFAVQADNTDIRTVEGLTNEDGTLGSIQEAFRTKHGLQCGFCTPGILMSIAALDAEPGPHSKEEMLEALGGHLCRCTGYRNIIAAGEAAIVDGRSSDG